ncbi:MAG: hypothetical protein FJ125_12540, partial [Deltaproteobacteria bacterium]|nr:hypothetical protein [Deltaproteobacteria bacterium]
MYRTKSLVALLGSALALITLGAVPARAALPLASINQEGLLLDVDGSPMMGSTQLTFSIYGGEAGALLWTGTYTVELHMGYYSVALGQPPFPLPSELFQAPELWLGIQVAGAPELQPRHRFEDVAYAVGANFAIDAVGDLHPRSITATGNIVTTADVSAQGTIRATTGFVGPNVTSGQNPGHAHTGAGIVDGSLGTAELADQAVTTAKLATLGVTSDKLANGAVVAGKLGPGAVGGEALQGGAVTTAKLADKAVTRDKIADGV